jgi:elongation factor P hydroxylase
MDRLVITIHPTPSDEGLLRVSDAMQQVIDALRVFEQAERVLVPPQEYFEWRLERASAGSPFTVVAVAAPLDATKKDVTPYILRVKSEVSHGIRNFISHGIPPRWMDPEGMVALRRLLSPIRTE